MCEFHQAVVHNLARRDARLVKVNDDENIFRGIGDFQLPSISLSELEGRGGENWQRGGR